MTQRKIRVTFSPTNDHCLQVVFKSTQDVVYFTYSNTVVVKMLIILDKIIINPSLIQISEKYNYIYTQEENLTNIAWHQICTSNKTNHTNDKTTPIQSEHHNSKINLLSISFCFHLLQYLERKNIISNDLARQYYKLMLLFQYILIMIRSI